MAYCLFRHRRNPWKNVRTKNPNVFLLRRGFLGRFHLSAWPFPVRFRLYQPQCMQKLSPKCLVYLLNPLPQAIRVGEIHLRVFDRNHGAHRCHSTTKLPTSLPKTPKNKNARNQLGEKLRNIQNTGQERRLSMVRFIQADNTSYGISLSNCIPALLVESCGF